ncbi:NADP-dependent oxidoreductase [Tateyamaria omphalii]|uniref:NADP-dependent oxidoreductase n=1 Tax=Tateyamaria omphalii TaxID=299262 RepID=UPI00167BB84B|nr:NADP-dependent oxidoreductase [Tateyamaria omphalii]GGX51421.1 NADP-dependent oxidoreductase [Tateyamaria omphalii]
MSKHTAISWFFNERPTDVFTTETLTLREHKLTDLLEGQFKVKTHYLSLDATNRVWVSDWDIYMDPVRLGEPMRGFVVGEVTESRNANFPVGSFASGMASWSNHVIGDETTFMPFPVRDDLGQAFAVTSIAGPTAHVGLHHIGELQENETIVVSGAAGAVGLMVCQLAKRKGCRVIGIAGSDEKCRMLIDDFDIDAAINYKTQDVTEALGKVCPDGIDLCFENVGGEILDASLTHMRDYGRVVICGLISSYTAKDPVPGPYMFRNIIMRRLSMRGFVILDYMDLMPKVMNDLGEWVQAGELRLPLHVVDGLENAVDAVNLLYTGGNTGKVLVRMV